MCSMQGMTVKAAAALMNVSERSVYYARRIARTRADRSLLTRFSHNPNGQRFVTCASVSYLNAPNLKRALHQHHIRFMAA